MLLISFKNAPKAGAFFVFDLLRNVKCFCIVDDSSKTMAYMSFGHIGIKLILSVDKEFVHYFNMLYTKKSIGIMTSAYFLE